MAGAGEAPASERRSDTRGAKRPTGRGRSDGGGRATPNAPFGPLLEIEGDPPRVDSATAPYRPWVMARKAVVARDPTLRLSYRSCVGDYASIKMGLVFPFESRSELDAMVLLDADPSVAAFRSQPQTFRWSDGGRKLRYTPDLLVRLRDGRLEYREVKPHAVLVGDPTLGGWRPLIDRELSGLGAGFRTWTDKEMRSGHGLVSARRIVSGYGHLFGVGAVERAELVRAALAYLGLPRTIGEVLAAVEGDRRVEPVILGLVAIGELAVDLDRPISDASVLFPGMGRVGVRSREPDVE